MSLIANPIFLGAPPRRMPPTMMRGLSAVTRRGMLARRGGRGMGDDSALGYLPVGTQLVYNVTVAVSLFTPQVNPSAANVAALVAANVSKNSGISVIGSNAPTAIFNSGGGITLTLQLNQPYTTAQMVQAVMDSAVDGLLGISVISSNISVSSVPGGASVNAGAAAGSAPVGSVPGAGAAASPASAPTDPLTWLTTNAGWVAAGVAGVFLLRELM